jgi:Xaa-Pro aminopeptidase
MIAAPADILSARCEALRAALRARDLDGLVVTALSNIAYLTGFFASAAALVVTPANVILIGDGRYAAPLKIRQRECPFLRTLELVPGSSYDQAVVGVLAEHRGGRFGFEAAHLTVMRHKFLIRALEALGWTTPLVDSDGMVERLRVRKDAWEVERLRDGATRLSAVAKCILPRVLAGRSEADVAAEIEQELRRAGFERPAFDTIVASGPNAALPHARPGQRRLEEGDLVVIDCGGVLDGYCTDLTRTIVLGHPSERQRRLLEQVAEAQAAAFGAIAAGVQPEAVDAAARGTLTSHGIGDAFSHGTGHGLGLEIHEAPRVTHPREDHPEPPLAAGMVLTLEPGAYFSGWGGVRIEDDVLVTTDGAEWLTDLPRIQ